MQKTILVTGSTDGIGLLAAKKLVAQGHNVLLHGRSKKKLKQAEKEVTSQDTCGTVETYTADLSRLKDVEDLAKAVRDKHDKLDVLINNAGVFMVPQTTTDDGYDVRFMVNTVAPYHLTKLLLPIIESNGRVVNLSSAAQAPVNLNALLGQQPLSDNDAYAESKLAIAMWTHSLAKSLKGGPVVVAVNPASFLATKMVKEAYGSDGRDANTGADIICRAATSDEFANASGKYYDNDARQFASPHPDALNDRKCQALVEAMETIIAKQ